MQSPQKAASDEEKSPLGPVKVKDLVFDELNPRLPESTIGRPKGRQDRILEYFRVHGNLEELAQSLVDNGYFDTEPLIVTKENAPDGKWVVLEGNRRLAALRMLLYGSATDLDRLDAKPTAARRKELSEVRALEVARHEDAMAMIGFRHIGGMKPWDSEPKARWIREQVEKRDDSKDPFADVGRMVGLNRGAVRSYYLAGALARVGAEQGLDINRFMVGDRFGVLRRATDNPQIRKYVGLSEEVDFEPLRRELAGVRKSPKRALRVLRDLSEDVGTTGRPLVADSRHITDYGRILANPKAEAKLRTEGWDAAAAELSELKLEEYVGRVLTQLRRLRDRLEEESTLPEAVMEKVRELQRIARTLGERGE